METLEHGVYYDFGKKSFSAKLIRGMFLPVGVLLIAAICMISAGNSGSTVLSSIGNGGIISAVGIAAFQAVVAYLEHVGTKFMISTNALYIRSGILNRREISVPFRHINNLHQYQSVTDRMLSVVRCTIEILEDEVAVNHGEFHGSDIIMKDVDIALLQPLREAILSHANTQRMYMVSDQEFNGGVSTDLEIEQKSRMYDQYINTDANSEYKPYDSQ